MNLPATNTHGLARGDSVAIPAQATQLSAEDGPALRWLDELLEGGRVTPPCPHPPFSGKESHTSLITNPDKRFPFREGPNPSARRDDAPTSQIGDRWLWARTGVLGAPLCSKELRWSDWVEVLLCPPNGREIAMGFSPGFIPSWKRTPHICDFLAFIVTDMRLTTGAIAAVIRGKGFASVVTPIGDGRVLVVAPLRRSIDPGAFAEYSGNLARQVGLPADPAFLNQECVFQLPVYEARQGNAPEVVDGELSDARSLLAESAQ